MKNKDKTKIRSKVYAKPSKPNLIEPKQKPTLQLEIE